MRVTRSDLQLLHDEIETEFPDFRIVKKSESRLMRAIDRFLRTVSFGRMTSFMDSFTTTIGNTVYVGDDWERRSIARRWITLSHERVHMEQARRHGMIVFALLYLLVLPVGLAVWRRRFEQEAYEVSMRCMAQAYGPAYLLVPEVRENMIGHFTSSQYLWMWLRRSDIEEWYDATTQVILEEEGYDPEDD